MIDDLTALPPEKSMPVALPSLNRGDRVAILENTIKAALIAMNNCEDDSNGLEIARLILEDGLNGK
jgi:hypothetical protein